ncbi:MAG: hypothetical protein QW338_00265 [Conexivisphaerales archaeon]
MKLYGSILGIGALRLEELIKRADSAGIDGFHFDISDGCFAPSLTFGPSLVKDLKGITSKSFDVHLMVSNPERYFGQLPSVDTVYFHAEAFHDAKKDISALKKLGVRAGIALSPGTGFEKITEIELADSVLVLLVMPGFSGQRMIAGNIQKNFGAEVQHSRRRGHHALQCEELAGS